MNDVLEATATDKVEVTGTAGDDGAAPTGEELAAFNEAIEASPIRGKKRAGITKNKGNGQGKARRKMAADSRRRNRRK